MGFYGCSVHMCEQHTSSDIVDSRGLKGNEVIEEKGEERKEEGKVQTVCD